MTKKIIIFLSSLGRVLSNLILYLLYDDLTSRNSRYQHENKNKIKMRIKIKRERVCYILYKVHNKTSF